MLLYPCFIALKNIRTRPGAYVQLFVFLGQLPLTSFEYLRYALFWLDYTSNHVIFFELVTPMPLAMRFYRVKH